MIRRDPRRLIAKREPDFLPGDPPGELVRVDGIKGVGFLESIDGDHATVAYGDHKHIIPLIAVRRIKQRGSNLDRRQV